MRCERPTYREIAKALGIHHTTVGRALSDHSRVAEATRARVWAKAREMGYRADPFISALQAHKGATAHRGGFCKIAVVIDSRTVFRFPAVARMRRGVEARADARGARIEYFPLDEYGRDIRSVAKVLRARGLKWVLVMAVSAGDLGEGEALREFFCASLNLRLGSLPSIMPDHFQCMRLTCRELASRGFRRPGLIIARSLDPTGMNRSTAAFRDFWAKTHGGSREAPVLREEHCDAATLSAWLERHRPDVVIESWRGVRDREFDPREPRWASWLRRHRPEIFDARTRSLQSLRALLGPYPYVILDSLEDAETGIDTNRAFCARKAVDLLMGAFDRGENEAAGVPFGISVEGDWVGDVGGRSRREAG